MSKQRVPTGRKPVAPRKRPRPETKILRVDRIQAREIEITDYKGRPVVRIGAYRGSGGMLINRADGRSLFVVGMDLEPAVGGGGYLAVWGPNGKVAASLLGRRQGGQVIVEDAAGNNLGRLAAFDRLEAGGARLDLRGRDTDLEIRNGRYESRVHPVADTAFARDLVDRPKGKTVKNPGFGLRLESYIW